MSRKGGPIRRNARAVGGVDGGDSYVGVRGRGEVLTGGDGRLGGRERVAHLQARGALGMPAETLPGAAASAAGMPAASAPIGGVAGLNPATAGPAVANAASMAIGAGSAPLSSIGQVGSVAQTGAAGGAGAGPGLASSVGQNREDTDTDGSADEEPGERLL